MLNSARSGGGEVLVSQREWERTKARCADLTALGFDNGRVSNTRILISNAKGANGNSMPKAASRRLRYSLDAANQGDADLPAYEELAGCTVMPAPALALREQTRFTLARRDSALRTLNDDTDSGTRRIAAGAWPWQLGRARAGTVGWAGKPASSSAPPRTSWQGSQDIRRASR